MLKELVYIVEDDIHIQQLLKYNLEAAGYKVLVFENGENLVKELQTSLPALFILDIMLPGMDGFEICRLLRSDPDSKEIPIIMLTAKSEEFDKVLGLEMGADDYITKPFSVRELMARVKALFRRTLKSASPDSEIIQHGDIEIDISRHEVYKKGQPVEMPLKEFDLLKILMQNKGKVLSREFLLDKIWGFDYYGETRTVDVHIRYIRQKIEEDDSNPIYIETIRGVGYRFSDKTERG